MHHSSDRIVVIASDGVAERLDQPPDDDIGDGVVGILADLFFQSVVYVQHWSRLNKNKGISIPLVRVLKVGHE